MSGGSGFLFVLAVFGALLIAAIWSATAFLVSADEAQERSALERSTDNLTHAFAAHVDKPLRLADEATDFVAFLERRGSLDAGALAEAAQRFGGDEFAGLAVYGALGSLRTGSTGQWPPEVRDLHLLDERPGLATGAAVRTGTSSGESGAEQWIIPAWRPLAAPGSRVVLAIPLEYFTRFFSSFAIGSDSLVTLVGRDGIVRARLRDGTLLAGPSRRAGSGAGEDRGDSDLLDALAHAPSGHYWRAAASDGVPRLVSYRTLPAHDLVVSVGLSEAQLLAAVSQRRSWAWTAAAAVALGVAAFIGWLFVAALRGARASGLIARQAGELAAVQLELVASNRRYTRAVLAAQSAIWEYDVAAGRFYFSPHFRQLAHLPAGPDEARAILARIHPADRDAASAAVHDLFSGGGSRRIELRLAAGSGTYRWMTVSGTSTRDGAGHVTLLTGSVRDITREHHLRERLRLRERALEASLSPVLITDARATERPIVYVNPAFERLTGYSASEVIGSNARFLRGNASDQPEVIELNRRLEEGLPAAHAVLRNFRKDGTEFLNEMHIAPIRDEQGTITHFVGVLNDVTAARRHGAELTKAANFDALTGLPNRDLLRDRIGRAIAHATREDHEVAVAIVDIDQFGLINDAFGQPIGDGLIQAIGVRLASAMRGSDTVARLGGDEFALVLSASGAGQPLAATLARLLARIAEPVRIGEQELQVTASIGYALFPHDGSTAAALLTGAGSALRLGRERGRNLVQRHQPAPDGSVAERLDLTRALRHALARGEFFLDYQPQFDFASGKMTGVEALLRWRHPRLGLVPPGRFIGLAEETGQIVAIGNWVLRTACRQNLAWERAGMAPLVTAVNVSVREFRGQDVVKQVAAVLAETGLPAERLELELTESIMAESGSQFAEALEALRALGVRIALDDFGTGYSSLSFLENFPLDRIKIDQSFVARIGAEGGEGPLLATIIQLGHRLGFSVVAEGVETAAQAEFLARNGCDFGQGYHFARPMPPEAIVAMLSGGKVHPFPVKRSSR